MALALTAFGLAALFVFLLQAWTKVTMSISKLPPGPLGFPIIGSLHLLVKCPHQALHKLAKKYGPIIHSPQSAESFLKTNDIVFANRPSPAAASYLTYDQKNISGSPYGSYLRNVRKMCTTQLLSHQKIDSFMPMRKQELNMLVDYIKEDSYQGISVDLTAKISSLSADMSCKMVFGKKYMEKEFDERGFMAVMKDFLQIVSIPYLGDYFPVIAPFDLQGLKKKIEAVHKVFDGFLEKIIDEHIQSKDENRTKDFVDIMLGYMGSEESGLLMGRDNIKGIMLDMLAGSMDTTSLSIDWTLSELMRNPRVMKKVQKELEEKIGLERIVE